MISDFSVPTVQYEQYFLNAFSPSRKRSQANKQTMTSVSNQARAENKHTAYCLQSPI